MDPAVTIREVAQAVGVSPSTVSRALSGTRRMDPELRAKVLSAAEVLSYRTNRVARALHALDGHRGDGRAKHREPLLPDGDPSGREGATWAGRGPIAV